jgi:hypothetical protein
MFDCSATASAVLLLFGVVEDRSLRGLREGRGNESRIGGSSKSNARLANWRSVEIISITSRSEK